MPTYQYQCTACGEGLEVVQKFTDEALTVCPACSGRLRKVFSSVGIVFKGSGFYRTDSRSSAQGGSPAKKPSETAASAGSDGGSSNSSSDSGSSASSSSGSGSSGSSGSGDGGGSGTSGASKSADTAA